jgi:hypothetical protein
MELTPIPIQLKGLREDLINTFGLEAVEDMDRFTVGVVDTSDPWTLDDELKGYQHESWCAITLNDTGSGDECSCRDLPDASYLFKDNEERRREPMDKSLFSAEEYRRFLAIEYMLELYSHTPDCNALSSDLVAEASTVETYLRDGYRESKDEEEEPGIV